MANRLTHKRRKCVKSPNIFRDKQEYSSLYTISSRSTSSVQSLEMASQISKQNSNQIRVYKGQHHKGDSESTPINGRPHNYGKYPKLPNEISQELQQKVYSNNHKKYYNDRSQFIKNKFDKLTLANNPRSVENKQPFQNPAFPTHMNPPQNQHYVINRLEESYWAKWKPNKCDEMDTWRNYLDQADYSRRPHCTTTRMLPQECLNMLAQTKRRHKNKCCEEKPLKIIRQPAEIQESKSSDICISKKIVEKKSKCSCCTCPRDNSDDERSLRCCSLKKEKCALKKYNIDQNEQTEDEENLDTSQEEYEHLYNEMYQEYETDLMNRISEYEMQKEEEEMREVEKQLAEQEMKRRAEEENSKKYRHGEDGLIAEFIPNQNHEMRENNDNIVGNEKNENGSINSKLDKRVRISTQDEEKLQNRQWDEINSGESVQISPRSEPRADSINEHERSYQAEVQRSSKERLQEIPVEQAPKENYPLEQVYPERYVEEMGQASTEEKQRTQSSPRNNARVLEKQEQEEHERETTGTLDDWEDYQKMEKLMKKLPANELTPHLSATIEYSEPEIAILKHTDSFIINSRRQKEDRPRKPQPKFIKLTKPTFSPTVKGHTYPLKPALKKEKLPSQPIIGFSRPLSPTTPKGRSSSKQFLPAYLLRH